jgi:hypothetical protein
LKNCYPRFRRICLCTGRSVYVRIHRP